jgi:hypothetical protein
MVQGRADGSTGPAGPALEKRGITVAPGSARRALWSCLRLLWVIAPRDRAPHKPLAQCRRYGRGQLVGLKRRHDRAHFSDLVYCGKTICPLCGPKIAAERAADIALALSQHYAAGGRVAFVTLTMPHTRAQRLSELLEGLTSSWAAIRQNKTPRRLLAAHAAGWIKRLEVTHGAHGWHPHLHLLVFLVPGVDVDQVDELAAAMYGAWSGRLIRRGLGETSPDAFSWKLLDLTAAHEQVAEYAAKAAALELASSGTKMGRRRSSRSPLQVLHDFGADGLAEDRAIWFEYVEAMYRRRAIEWSQGLRDRLIGDIAELTDEQAAAADDSLGRLLGYLDRDTWKRIRSWEGGPAAILDWAEVVDDHDQAAELVRQRLADHGLGQLLDTDSDSGREGVNDETTHEQDARSGARSLGPQGPVGGVHDTPAALRVGDRPHVDVTPESRGQDGQRRRRGRSPAAAHPPAPRPPADSRRNARSSPDDTA